MFENSSTSYTGESKTNFENTTSNFKHASFTSNYITNQKANKLFNHDDLLNKEEVELRQVCKLFADLSLTQRKQFLASIIETFDEKLLKSLNFILGSLNHKDFSYKVDYSIKKPKINKSVTINLNAAKESTTKPKAAKQQQAKPSGRESKINTPARLPSITERPRTNMNVIVKRKRSHLKSLINRGYTIDKFVLNKSLEIIESPWSLKNYTINNKVSANTENLIFKLKKLFRRQYQISSSSQLNSKKSSKTESGTLSSNDFFATRNNSLRSMSNGSVSARNSKSRNTQINSKIINTSIDLKAMYLKKLKNNYYDRKLWDSLVNSANKLNINPYADQSAREYNSEFNILKHHDWTMSSFAETVSKFSVKMPPINKDSNRENYKQEKKLSFDMKRISTATKFSKLQQAILTENKDVRLKYLNSIMEFVPMIKKWSNLSKQNLLQLLLKHDSKDILEFLRDSIKKRIKPKVTTIDHLPDSVLLNIFSRLDMETLEKVELVCNRWNFLANTPELWIFKCKKLGEQENLGQIEALIVNELSNDEDIDWKLAYTELTEFVKRLKQYYLDKFNDMNSRQTDSETLKSASISKREVSFAKSTRNNSAVSYVNFYTKDDEESDEDIDDLFFDVDLDSNVSENLKKLDFKRSKNGYGESIMDSQNEKYNEKEHLKFQKESRYLERRQIESKYFKSGPEFMGDFNEVVIKTELSPTKDLLNKVVPNYKLRWKLEDEDLRPNESIIGTLKPITKVLSLNNHTAAITCIDYDKKRIVTGGLDRMIFVYDFKHGKCLGQLEGHKGGIRCLQILKNRLCSGSFDQTVIIWNMYHFEKVISLGYTNVQDSISCLYFDFDYLICGSHDTRINIWKFNPNYVEEFEKPTVPFSESDILSFDKMILHHKSAVTALTYDGINSIISANAEGLILIIDIDGDLLRELSFTSEIEPITCLRLVGSLILTTTVKGKVLFWNRKDESLETIIKCNNDYTVSVNSIAFQGLRFYTAGSDCLIKEWDLQSLTCLRQFVAHDGPVLDLIAVDNKIISCGADRAIIWDFNTPIEKKSKTKKLK